jgi:hypothetical protein
MFKQSKNFRSDFEPVDDCASCDSETNCECETNCADEHDCGDEFVFDRKSVPTSECDMKRVKNLKVSDILAVKIAERVLCGLRTLDGCDKVWETNEKINVATKIGGIAVGSVVFIETVSCILSNAIGRPLARKFNLKKKYCDDDACEDDDCEDEEEEDAEEEDAEEEDAGEDVILNGGKRKQNKNIRKKQSMIKKRNIFIRMWDKIKKK